MKKLVIFDLDGTLLDTIEDLGNATNYALERCGFAQHAPESYRQMVGNGVTKLIERSLPVDARTPDTIEQVRDVFREYYDEHLTDFTRPYDGIPELLANLRDSGVAIAVASNKYDSAVKRLIAHFFGDYEWAAVEGHIPDYPSKPDPSIVFRILSGYPTPKAQVLYVGDSGVDMETARRACVESVGVTWGFRPVSELRDCYADHIIYNPADILPLAVEKATDQ
ncbi:MAG: HAD family hydrolase [Paramuribaculum sp.]|nr:HAD family hydrolase [Paramuribaculum sp.]MDE7469996.1 HAD family hydrolase [Paramuribaculum sp.]